MLQLAKTVMTLTGPPQPVTVTPSYGRRDKSLFLS